MNDRRRPRVPAKPKAAPQLTGPVQLDDDTRNALILFNARLVAQDELEREKRRVDKATKAKDEAAAKVRQLENDPKATSEQKSEAQAGYLASLDALNRAKAGEPAGAETHDDADDSAETDDEPTDAADDAAPETHDEAVAEVVVDEVADEAAPEVAVAEVADEAAPDATVGADAEAPAAEAAADPVDAPTEAADEPDPSA